MTNPGELWLMLVGVAVLGGIGAVLRFWVNAWSGYLPWGTLAANTVASFVVGVNLPLPGNVISTWLVVGLAGGLSTFSTFVAQTGWWLWKRGRVPALLNVLTNLGLPILAVLAGSSVSLTLLN